MGKIKTEGCLTLKFEPDLYEIEITVRAEGKTTGAAVTVGKKQTEKLLQSLQDELGIKPEHISAEGENLNPPQPYRDDKNNFSYSRRLLLTLPADNKLREAITDLLAEMDAVTYSVNAKLSDEAAKKQLALDAAVQLAKKKAEQLASALNCRIVGFEEIFTDKTGDIQFEETARGIASPAAFKSNASQLKNPQIEISGEVTVVWLTEPLS